MFRQYYCLFLVVLVGCASEDPAPSCTAELTALDDSWQESTVPAGLGVPLNQQEWLQVMTSDTQQIQCWDEKSQAFTIYRVPQEPNNNTQETPRDELIQEFSEASLRLITGVWEAYLPAGGQLMGLANTRYDNRALTHIHTNLFVREDAHRFHWLHEYGHYLLASQPESWSLRQFHLRPSTENEAADLKEALLAQLQNDVAVEPAQVESLFAFSNAAIVEELLVELTMWDLIWKNGVYFEAKHLQSSIAHVNQHWMRYQVFWQGFVTVLEGHHDEYIRDLGATLGQQQLQLRQLYLSYSTDAQDALNSL